MALNLVRYKYGKRSTQGILYIAHEPIDLFTLENDWEGNENGVSCIPEGCYDLRYRKAEDSPSRDYDHLLVEGVPGRSYILFHIGNSTNHTEGCILTGKTAGKDFVGHSRDGHNILMDLFRQEKFATLEVTSIDFYESETD